MKKEPLVSIIIPVYNVEKYVGAALDSVFAQTYKNIEVIAVDDCSRDGTVEVVNRYRDRLQFYRLPQNGGATAALNVGLLKAKGGFILTFDADDIMEPDAIGRFVALFEEHPEADFAYCKLYAFYEDLTIRYEFRHSCPARVTLKRLVMGNFLKLSQVMIRKKFLDDHALKFNASLRYSGDWDLWLHLVGEGGVGLLLDAQLINSRERASGQSSSVRGTFLAKKEHLAIWARWGTFLTPEEKAEIHYDEMMQRTRRTMLFNALGVDDATRAPLFSSGDFSSLEERVLVFFIKILSRVFPPSFFGALEIFYYRTKTKVRLMTGGTF
jgi:glycosyltransferase involved in cell wall biosynthesis